MCSSTFLSSLILFLSLLGQHWLGPLGHRVQHNKDEPCILDILMQLIRDVMQDALHVLLVNTKKIVEDNRRPHPPKSLGKLVDIADGVDVKGIASLLGHSQSTAASLSMKEMTTLEFDLSSQRTR